MAWAMWDDRSTMFCKRSSVGLYGRMWGFHYLFMVVDIYVASGGGYGIIVLRGYSRGRGLSSTPVFWQQGDCTNLLRSIYDEGRDSVMDIVMMAGCIVIVIAIALMVAAFTE